MQPTGKLRILLRWLLVLCAVTSITVAYREGVSRKYDARLTYGFEHDGASMAIGLSRVLFGFHEGYIGYRDVYNAVRETLSPYEIADPRNIASLQSREKIDEALARVQAIDPQSLPVYKKMGIDFVTIYAEDIGLADMFTLAYSIFGLHADALYKMYFLVFALSAALFVAEHRNRLGALALLALTCGSFLLFFFSNVFDQSQMPSVNANRFGGTLGFIPILHLLCVMRARLPLTRQRIFLLLAQSLLFALAFSIRNTTKWQLLLCLLVMLVMAYPYLRQKMPFKRIARQAAIASCLLFLAGFSVYNIVQMTQLNRMYFRSCNTPHHMTWHSIILGLSYHPHWREYNDFSPAMGGDGIAWHAFERVMKEKGENYTCPQIGGMHRVRPHEKTMRAIFFDFVLRHPVYMLELQFQHKPLALYQLLAGMMRGVETWIWTALGAASVVTGLATAWLARGRRPRIMGVLGIGALGLFLSTLPFLLAYPTAVMVDLLWMLAINGALWVWALSYYFCRAYIQLVHKP